MEKMKTSVILCGQEFKVACDESPAYIQGIADYVNKRIEDITAQYPNLSIANAVLLATLNIADELHQLRTDYDELDSRIKMLRELPKAAPARHEAAQDKTAQNQE